MGASLFGPMPAFLEGEDMDAAIEQVGPNAFFKTYVASVNEVFENQGPCFSCWRNSFQILVHPEFTLTPGTYADGPFFSAKVAKDVLGCGRYFKGGLTVQQAYDLLVKLTIINPQRSPTSCFTNEEIEDISRVAIYMNQAPVLPIVVEAVQWLLQECGPGSTVETIREIVEHVTTPAAWDDIFPDAGDGDI